MKKLLTLLIVLFALPGQANAEWIDFGEYFGGDDLCNGSQYYTADNCGMPVDVVNNLSYVPPNLRHPGVVYRCNYFFSTRACCCQGLVWVPEPPSVRSRVLQRIPTGTIKFSWDPEPRNAVEAYAVSWRKDGSSRVSTKKIPGTSTSIVVRGLEKGKVYEYKIVASARYGLRWWTKKIGIAVPR